MQRKNVLHQKVNAKREQITHHQEDDDWVWCDGRTRKNDDGNDVNCDADAQPTSRWRRLRTGEPEVKANEEDWLKEQSGVLEVVEDGVAVVDEVAEAHRPSGIENLNIGKIRVAS